MSIQCPIINVHQQHLRYLAGVSINARDPFDAAVKQAAQEAIAFQKRIPALATLGDALRSVLPKAAVLSGGAALPFSYDYLDDFFHRFVGSEMYLESGKEFFESVGVQANNCVDWLLLLKKNFDSLLQAGCKVGSLVGYECIPLSLDPSIGRCFERFTQIAQRLADVSIQAFSSASAWMVEVSSSEVFKAIKHFYSCPQNFQNLAISTAALSVFASLAKGLSTPVEKQDPLVLLKKRFAGMANELKKLKNEMREGEYQYKTTRYLAQHILKNAELLKSKMDALMLPNLVCRVRNEIAGPLFRVAYEIAEMK